MSVFWIFEILSNLEIAARGLERGKLRSWLNWFILRRLLLLRGQGVKTGRFKPFIFTGHNWLVILCRMHYSLCALFAQILMYVKGGEDTIADNDFLCYCILSYAIIKLFTSLCFLIRFLICLLVFFAWNKKNKKEQAIWSRYIVIQRCFVCYIQWCTKPSHFF